MSKQNLSSDSEDDCSVNSSDGFSFLSNLSGQLPLLPKQWAKSKQCHICNKPLSKLHGSLRHHCRFCGETVCKYHSQHSQTHPLTSESVRCCDTCQKNLIGVSTREEIARRLTDLQAKLAEANRDIVRTAKDIERREIVAQSLAVEVESKRKSAEECRKIYEDCIAHERDTCAQLKARVAVNRENYTYSASLLHKVRDKHAQKQAEFTELTSEVDHLRSELEKEKRRILEENDLLSDRIPESLVGTILGTCCRPKYYGVSFNARRTFDAGKFRESLYKSQRKSVIRETGESCKCEII